MLGISLNWNKIKLVVFDVDGTLYNHRSIRKQMLVLLIKNAIQTHSLKTLKCIYHYRKLREVAGDKQITPFNDWLLSKTSEKTSLPKEQVNAIVQEWLIQRPQEYLKNALFENVASVFETLKEHQIKVGIFSDYPVIEKLNSMGLSADYYSDASSPEIDALKPLPKGLTSLIQKAHVSPQETLMIGDREERDGLVAQNADTHFLLCEKWNKKEVPPEVFYKKLSESCQDNFTNHALS
ncbi:HAD family hydrolase [Acetobacteraceae bacterium]|nr:HAD family hydrolase [Acetobacteraceae bacterium]